MTITFLLLTMFVAYIILSWIQRQAKQGKRKKDYKPSELAKDKGDLGESAVCEVLQKNLKHPFILRNVYLPNEDRDNMTEIDIVAICSKGILCIEVKNYAGFIRGDVTSKKWMNIYSKNCKMQFYSPILQNDAHLIHLERFIEQDNQVTPITVFTGEAVLHLSGDLSRYNVLYLDELADYLLCLPDKLTSQECVELYGKLNSQQGSLMSKEVIDKHKSYVLKVRDMN